jgi:hypothetical protein
MILPAVLCLYYECLLKLKLNYDSLSRNYIHGHWVPFPSPLTTRRATVEVFYHASTRVHGSTVEVQLRPTVSWPVLREEGSVVYSYNCFWALSEQSLWSPSPAELRPYSTVSYEIRTIWRARSSYLYPPGTGWPSYTSKHWVPFSSPLTALKIKVTLRPTVSRPVRLGVRRPSGTRDQFLFLLEIFFR